MYTDRYSCILNVYRYMYTGRYSRILNAQLVQQLHLLIVKLTVILANCCMEKNFSLKFNSFRFGEIFFPTECREQDNLS